MRDENLAKYLTCPAEESVLPTTKKQGASPSVHGRTRREGVGWVCARREGTGCKLGKNVVDSFGFVLDKI